MRSSKRNNLGDEQCISANQKMHYHDLSCLTATGYRRSLSGSANGFYARARARYMNHAARTYFQVSPVVQVLRNRHAFPAAYAALNVADHSCFGVSFPSSARNHAPPAPGRACRHRVCVLTLFSSGSSAQSCRSCSMPAREPRAPEMVRDGRYVCR